MKQKYRIKIIKYLDGREEYYIQVKKIIWMYFNTLGELYLSKKQVTSIESRKDALILIDFNFKNYLRNKENTIEFEYIIKNK